MPWEHGERADSKRKDSGPSGEPSAIWRTREGWGIRTPLGKRRPPEVDPGPFSQKMRNAETDTKMHELHDPPHPQYARTCTHASASAPQALRRPGLPCLLCGLQEERAPLPTLLPEERRPGSLTETHPGLAAPSHPTPPLGPCRPSGLTSPAV